MEENRKECTVFEGERIALAPPRRIGVYVRVRTVVLFCALLVGVVFVCAKTGVFNGLPELLGIVGGSESDSETEETAVAETDSELSTESESFAKEDDSESCETSEIEVETTETDGVIGLDLAEAERGAAYIVNYTGQNLDAEGIFEMGFGGGRYSYTERPVIMILHTHTSEGYYDFDPEAPLHAVTKSVVAVGERMAYALNQNGIPTIHCTVINDGEGEKGSYESAAKTIKTMLDIYPSIEYIIDVHRISENGAGEGFIRTESGVGSAQVRLTVSGEGILTRDTLALAMHLRMELNREGKRLCMPVVLTDSEYNSWLSPYYLKIDIGSAGNSTEEALVAGDYLADALADLLKK